MVKKVILPREGLQMEEGTITKWFKKEGDVVSVGDELFEMETDKLRIAVEATAEGHLLEILHGEDETLPIATVVGIIGNPGEDYSSLLEAESLLLPKAQPADVIRTFITPRAKAAARDKGIDYSIIKGSGTDGLIIEKDILNIAADVPTMSVPEIRTDDESLIPFSSTRKMIAKRMKESLDVMAQTSQCITVDMSDAIRIKEQYDKSGQKISYNDIVLYCTAKALKEYPYMNASYSDAGVIHKHCIHLGIALATDNGLFVPVIRNVDKMRLKELALSTADVIARARNNTIRADELTESTFTVSNLGMYDIDSFIPIINPPESGILGVGKIEKRPIVNERDEIIVRPMMQLSLTYDHRIIDGAPAARFLNRIKELLENPCILL